MFLQFLKHRFIKLGLVTEGKFCFHFSHVHGSVADCINVNPARMWHLNHALHDGQNACTLTKVGTVLNRGFIKGWAPGKPTGCEDDFAHLV